MFCVQSYALLAVVEGTRLVWAPPDHPPSHPHERMSVLAPPEPNCQLPCSPRTIVLAVPSVMSATRTLRLGTITPLLASAPYDPSGKTWVVAEVASQTLPPMPT